MKSIATRFSLAVVAFAVVFSAVVLYVAWSSTRRHVEAMASLQASLAMEFDLALRQYAREVIRPEVEKRVAKDDFILEVMSTSYIARQVFERLQRKFPDCVVKFSSDNPRNPKNLAGPKELELLAHFRRSPKEQDWTGTLEMEGDTYFARVHPMLVEESCLRCHGRPEDSPKALLTRYGTSGGFGRKVGDVAGMDVIAIPMSKIEADLRTHALLNVLGTAFCLVVLFGAILLAFRMLVGRRLASITSHFREAAAQPGQVLTFDPPGGDDEIGILAKSFNDLAARLSELHRSLEDRVRERTAELRDEQRVLRQLLQASDHERRVLAYEIHDGLAQELTGAIMHLETALHLGESKPAAAAEVYRSGLAMLQHSLAEARRLINGVRPPVLDEFGIVAAIEHLIQDRKYDEARPAIAFDHEVAFDRLSPVLENAIYRIIQEGLGNALKHGRCDNLRIALTQVDGRVHIRIEDDGVGFDPHNVAEGHFGLEGIRERARLLGGCASIESVSGGGTRVTVELPLAVPA